MTRDQFYQQFAGRMLLFVTDAWANRAASPSDMGHRLQSHQLQAKELLRDMYDALNPPKAEPIPARNGTHTLPMKGNR